MGIGRNLGPVWDEIEDNLKSQIPESGLQRISGGDFRYQIRTICQTESLLDRISDHDDEEGSRKICMTLLASAM